MLLHLLAFERRQVLRNGVFWIVALVFGALAFAIMTTDAVQLGGGIGNTHRNAPYVIVQSLGMFTVLSLFLVTVFVAGTALRDFELRTAELFFATPMKKRDYLLGRFGGGYLASLGVMLFTALGIWLGSMMPWLDSARLGPMRVDVYLWAFAVIVLPNLLFISALLFLLATLTRSMLFTYLGVIGFFALWSIAGQLTTDLDARWIGTLLDPFGLTALAETTRYWSSAERNLRLPELGGQLLANRALWVGIALVLLAMAFRWFRADREGIVLRKRKLVATLPDTAPAHLSSVAPTPVPAGSASAHWRQFVHQALFDTRGVLIGIPFLVILALGLFNLLGALAFSEEMFGTSTYPVTHQMLETLNGAYNFLLVIIVTFYAGELVWRERAMRVAEATDAYATPDWVPLVAKLVALSIVIIVFFAIGMLACMGYQLWRGYTNFELLLYAKMLVVYALPFMLMGTLAIFLQVISGNKFIGYLLMIVFLIARIALPALDFDHRLYQFGQATVARWSDMNGFGHFLAGNLWFRAYWAALAAVLLVVAAIFWPRGTTLAWRDRVRQAKARFRWPQRLGVIAGLVAFAAIGLWIFHNTNRLNEYVPGDVAIARLADYEKTYRIYKDLAQPRIRDVRADVDIYPDQRRVVVRGHYRLVNTHAEPIAELHVELDHRIVVKRLAFAAHAVTRTDPVHGHTIYTLDVPMAPGATMDFDFAIDAQAQGFTLDGSDTQLVYNGTFFNNAGLLPQFGYNARRELQDRNDRRKHDLGEPPRMPKIDDEAARANHYISDDADWVTFETTVSTSPDQIALAPGYLQREWTENGRRYFHYKADTKLLPFTAWLSARWEVKRDSWNDIAIEVYYDAKHPYNVDRMIASAKKSFDYFTAHFSPYQFRQLRILQFPGYERFAQAFANTVPYSESIGFIADLRDAKDIDYVFYVTAHEVAHQWWAHQVIGANVQGSTMLSESLAQYSALMVMEHEYGPHKMRKFLKYELDRYLSSRSGERIEELPLALVENQPYIHYRKGSIVFYALKDAIGEDTLNAVLARFLKDKGFQDPPYTTSREFLAYLREGTDPRFHALIEDLFEKIVFFDHRVTDAKSTKRDDGKYTITLDLHAGKMIADGKGVETEAPIDGWVDIGVFARPPGGDEADEKVLYLQKHHIMASQTTLEIIVDEAPYDAGIDPYNKLIDRDSNDNRKRVAL